MRVANLALRFVLELCLLVALAVWGFGLDSAVAQILVGIGAPVAAAAVWGLFVAPKAPNRLGDPWRLVLELALFSIAATALAAAGHVNAAVVFALAIVVSETLMLVWRQRDIA